MAGYDRKSCTKVSRNEEVDGEIIFCYKDNMYMDEPKHTYLKYYMYDSKNDLYYAIMKKERWTLHILLMIMIALVVYAISSYEPLQHKVTYLNTVYLRDGYIGLNIINDESNTNAETFVLYYENIPLTDEYVLQPGQSIGNVPIISDYNFVTGSYMCKLHYEVENNNLGTTAVNCDVLLIVE